MVPAGGAKLHRADVFSYFPERISHLLVFPLRLLLLEHDVLTKGEDGCPRCLAVEHGV